MYLHCRTRCRTGSGRTRCGQDAAGTGRTDYTYICSSKLEVDAKVKAKCGDIYVQCRYPAEDAAKLPSRHISLTFSFPFGSRHDLTPQTGRYLRSAGMKKVFLVEGLKNRKSNADVICRSSVGSMACSELTAEIEVFAALRRQVVGSLG